MSILEEFLSTKKVPTKRTTKTKNSYKKYASFGLYTKAVGLPAKSYMWIITIDYHIYNLLSFLCKKDYFNEYILSHLTYRHLAKHREIETTNFLNFLMTTDQTRVYFIYPTRSLSRQKSLLMVATLSENCKQFVELGKKLLAGKELTDEELAFYSLFQNKIGFDETLYRVIEDINIELRSIMHELYFYFKSLIIKDLLMRRKGDSDPDHLRTDAYEVILSMIDQFSLRKESKMPFVKQLSWLSKSRKNKIIQYENWGLTNEGCLLSLDTLENEEENASLQEEIMDSVEQNLLREKEENNVHSALFELAHSYLPLPFINVIGLLYGIASPLAIEEEIQLQLSQL
jgi:hypothetical protein